MRSAEENLGLDTSENLGARVCFVTVEFHGLFRNGGIGTANTALALALAGAGCDVTIAVATNGPRGMQVLEDEYAAVREHYAGLGVGIEFIPPCPGIPNAYDDPQLISWSVYQYLREKKFDTVFFNDNGGQGYYTMLAKKARIFAPAPRLVVVAHGPMDWVCEINLQEYYFSGLQIAFMEARSVALADTLVSPSQYLMDWMGARGWVSPGQGQVVQNLIGAMELPISGAAQPVRELVFFGRQEIRKGIDLFCDALDALFAGEAGGGVHPERVTFLGKFSRAGGLHSGIYLAERARRWPVPMRILTEYGQAQALEYLREPGRLAVIPSRAENSPCVVAECLLQGIPFLAADGGGTAELIAVDDRAACLFKPLAETLAERLRTCLTRGQTPGRMAVPQADTKAQWMALARERERCRSLQGSARPGISVCLAGDASPQFKRCLAALAAQSVAPLEILVAPIGGMAAQAGVVMLPGGHASRAGARNQAAQWAQGEFLLFLDEPRTELAPEAIATLAAAARDGVDILTCMAAPMPDASGELPVLPLGACLERALAMDCFNDGAFMVRRAGFGDGFPEDGPDQAAIWRYLLRATVAGATLELVPAPLLRRHAEILLQSGVSQVEARRSVLEDVRSLPLGRAGRLLEAGLRRLTPREASLEALANSIGGAAGETIRRLQHRHPNDALARKHFVNYCQQTGLAALAEDFARENDASLLAQAPPENAAAPQAAPKVQSAPKLQRIPFSRLRDTEVLTNTSGLDFIVFRLGPPMLLHPVAGRLSVARFRALLPPGSTGVQCMVGLGDERAHPVEFALWAYPEGTGPDSPELPAEGVPSSEWLRIAKVQLPQALHLELPAPCAGAFDVYIATRVPEQTDAYFCHALWHEFTVRTAGQEVVF